MGLTTIEWTEATWNPVTGCSKVSDGCLHCYAERFAERLRLMGQYRYRNGFKVTIHEDAIEQPLSWKKPRMVFVNSMSDLFHEDIPDAVIERVFKVMNQAKIHTFQVLTKRPDRMLQMSNKLNWSPNIWQGVSVENEDVLSRVDILRQVPSSTRFLSCEPLLGPLTRLDLDGIHWVIVGGESGPMSRPMDIEWVRDIRDMCVERNVPFFFKQWGGTNKKKSGRELDGVEWSQYPVGNERYLSLF